MRKGHSAKRDWQAASPARHYYQVVSFLKFARAKTNP
jgi:hypothetical protein